MRETTGINAQSIPYYYTIIGGIMRRANGTGSVHKMSGNRRNPYRARATIGWDENGKQLYKELGSYAKAIEADRVLIEYLDNPEAFNEMKLKDVYKKWTEIKYLTISDKTIEMYENAWKHMSNIEDIEFKTIKTHHFQSTLDPESSKSLNRQIKVLASQLYDFAIENDWAVKNYAAFIRVIGKDPKPKELFTDEEIKTLWINQDKEFVDYILIMLYTGYRIGEMVTLKKDMIKSITIQDTEYWYAVHGNKTETGKNKLVPFPLRIKPIIEKYYNQNSEYIVEKDGGRVLVSYYREYMFNRVLERLGLNPKLTPHSTRHYYITMLNRNVKNKMTIANLAGHTDYNTSKIYTHEEIHDFIEVTKNL